MSISRDVDVKLKCSVIAPNLREFSLENVIVITAFVLALCQQDHILFILKDLPKYLTNTTEKT